MAFGLVKRRPDGGTPWYHDEAKRAVAFQLLVAGLLAAVLYYIISNTLSNMQTRGIASGFDFLQHRAGFGILQSLIPYDEADSYGRTFFVGLLNTLLVSGLGILCATVLGFIIGIARLSSNWLLSRLATVYIETFRNIPLLLQIFFWYFAVLRTLPSPRQSLVLGDAVFLNVRGLYLPAPIFEQGMGWVLTAFAVTLSAVWWTARRVRKNRIETGRDICVWPYLLLVIVLVPSAVFLLLGRPMAIDIPHLQGFNFRGGMSVIPELAALLVALTIYTAAFIAEIVRSGINAVGAGQSEASSALGLSRMQALRLVILPQAMRVIVPPLTSQFLNLTKNSSLATAIGYPDLVSVFMGTTLNQTGQAIEIIAMTMLVYLAISLLTSFLMNQYNRKMALVER
ncbi:amino acid ABC transporter permease [Pseudaeromonas sharmana]|uniref:Amino acid ABC transporter permease n=1 Tax=Pseudaeromonas sharmana TaxID=328412 RepID=A0ABV8CP56_9GAMM